MEEKIKDILSNIKDRLSNPLIFSFLISWLLYNWEIAVALFWYDKSQITADGHKSIFEFIQNKLDTKYYSTVFPLGFTFLYTFGMPYLKEFVDLMNKNAVLFGKKWKTKLLKDDLHLKIKDLEDKLNQIGNTSLLNGDWDLTIYSKLYDDTGQVLREDSINIQVYISGREYYKIDKDLKKKVFHISDFYYNPVNNSILFKMRSYSNRKEGDFPLFEDNLICNLNLDNGYWYNLSGMHNDTKVEYRKIK